MSQTPTIRLSPRQAQIAYLGFRPVYLQHINHQHGNYFRSIHPSLLPHRFHGDHGRYDADLMHIVVGVYEKAGRGRMAGIRVSLSYLESSAVLVAVRAASKLIRHGHVGGFVPPRLDRSIAQVIRKLEAEQKRLKRECIKLNGDESFVTLSSSWRSFVRHLKVFYLTCDCDLRIPSPLYKYQHARRQHFYELTIDELKKRGAQLREVRLLRLLVRRELSNARRREKKFPTIHHLVLRDSLAAQHLADYVEFHANNSNH